MGLVEKRSMKSQMNTVDENGERHYAEVVFV